MLMDVGKKRRSVAAASSLLRCAHSLLERAYERSYFVQRVSVERVVDPAPIAAVRHEPGVLERLQMERQPRLCRVEVVGELADAAFAAEEALDDLQPRLVGEGMEPAGGLRGVEGGGCGHELNVSIFLDMSSALLNDSGAAGCARGNQALNVVL